MVRDELHAVGLDVVHRVDGEVRQGELVLLGELARGAVDVLALDVDHDDVDLLAELLELLLHVVGGGAAPGSPGGVEINDGLLACAGEESARRTRWSSQSSTEFPDASRSAPLPMTAARVVSSPVVTSMMGMSAKACPTDMVAVLGSETVGSAELSRRVGIGLGK